MIAPPTPLTRGFQRSLDILFLVSAHNSLSQRAQIELTEQGHRVAVAVVDTAPAMEAAVAAHPPELIACPFLKTMIPESVWSKHRCLIVHPGPMGDRGPSSLDWAIELGMDEWGVTVLEATGDVDGGDVWATRTFRLPADAGKSSLYRHEVRRAAVEALAEAINKIVAGDSAPEQVGEGDPRLPGRPRPLLKQDVRAIDWSADTTATVLRKIRAAEGHPGVLDTIEGTEFFLFGAHRERSLRGLPGEPIAQRAGAICRATVDGAVWITHLKQRDDQDRAPFKLPATRALALAGHELELPELPSPILASPSGQHTFHEIAYRESAGVGYLYFDFYNGAMSTEQCRRLHEAYLFACSRPQTRVLALMGGRDFFSNGIHLNVIEAADDPAGESWRNLNAINDIVRAIVETESHVVVSALAGDAAAGGVPLVLAADYVVAREDVVLNPYYQHMGGLFGSEYWTYLLPRRVGAGLADRLTSAPFTALGTDEAVEIGLLDDAFGATVEAFRGGVRCLGERLARDLHVDRWLEGKRRRRLHDERIKPLAAYRTEELARSHACFFGEDRSYHEARSRFVRKQATGETQHVGPPRYELTGPYDRAFAQNVALPRQL
jgi:putative two-component system hydrogenase maturation factor HypX/HoxX